MRSKWQQLDSALGRQIIAKYDINIIIDVFEVSEWRIVSVILLSQQLRTDRPGIRPARYSPNYWSARRLSRSYHRIAL
jgi:hypothetical protein